MLYFLLLLVVSQAAKNCGKGLEAATEADTCVACAATHFKAADGATMCEAKANTAASCLAKQRAFGATGTSAEADDSTCAVDCNEGYATDGDAATGDCAAKCAAGFGRKDDATEECAACTAGTNFSAGGAISAKCTAVTPCADKTAPKAAIPGTATTDEACGCAGGQFGTGCATKCDDGKFLVTGDNVSKTAADCAVYTVCKGTATESAKNGAGADEWGTKTDGNAGADAVCNDAKPDAKPAASSAAVLAIPAFLIALLF